MLNSRGRIDSKYISLVSDDDYERFSVLGGNAEKIDTSLEIALLSYYSQPILNIRPAEADAMLPKNNPKLADQKLGAAVFQEIQILRFLNDTAAVSRYESILQFIIDRQNVTQQEIESFYRDGIHGLVSNIVNENSAEPYYGTPTTQALTDIKNIIIQFFLDPTPNNFSAIKQHMRYYDKTDGDRGIAAYYTIYNSMCSFSIALGNALVNDRVVLQR